MFMYVVSGEAEDHPRIKVSSNRSTVGCFRRPVVPREQQLGSQRHSPHSSSYSTTSLTLHQTPSYPPRHILKMNAVARRAAFAATRAPVRVTRRQASGVTSGAVPAEERKQDASAMKKGAKKDPELYVRPVQL
jgi:hypothetical protein